MFNSRQGRDAVREQPPGKVVPALRNAILLIEQINRQPTGSASLAELTAALGLTKSHCHAILKTLTHLGWLRFDARTKTYELAAGLLASASSLLASPELARIRERLGQLVRETGFSCVLTQPRPDGCFVVLDNLANNNPMLVSYAIGSSLPGDSPAQMRAFLAWSSQDVRERWLASWTPRKFTENTVSTMEGVLRELRATRERGYSRSLGEHFDGMLAYGLPIFGRDGQVLYIFCLAGFVQQAPDLEVTTTRAMQRAARDIHLAIMASPPQDFLENV